MNKLTYRQLDALDRIEKEPVLQPFFFKKLRGLKWFDELEKRGFFSPELNPRPVQSDQEGYFSVPGWPILDYLEQTASELQQPENLAYADKFLNIIRDVTRSAIAKNDVGNYRTWWCFAKIFRFIPIDKITKEDIELIEYWLGDRFDRVLVGIEIGKQLLPHLLANDSKHAQNLAIDVINTLTALTWHSRKWGNTEEMVCSFPVKTHFSNEIFSGQARLIGDRLEESGVSIFRDRLLQIFSKSHKDKYSTIWRPAIEDHEQNKDRDDVENILVSAFRDALLGYVDRRAAAAVDYVDKLLDSETILFQRVAIYITGVYSRQLDGLVKKLIDTQYFGYHYQHEMYHLLQYCFSGFDEKDKQKVLSIVESIAEQSKELEQPKDVQEEQQACTWLKWLSAIRGKGYQQADDLYAENLEITKAEPEHPDFSSYMEVKWVGEHSPYSVDGLLSRDFGDLVKILKSFKEVGRWENPSRSGLAQTLKEALKTRPELFKGHLKDLIDLDFDYTYQLIEGYKELWKERQYDNWVELLDFCWALLQSAGFWLDDAAEQRGNMAASSHWIVGAISELIRAGTADDKTAFEPTLLPISRKIIVHILDNQEGEFFPVERDAVLIAINSPRGKCVEALINYALRCCRLADKSNKGHDELWIKDLQPVFDEQVHQTQNGNLEFVTLFANYIPNLLYLSRSWTLEQLPIIFKKDSRLRWLCAMQGYAHVNQVYAQIYRFLSVESHFRDALDAQELGTRCKDQIIQNIVIAYLQGNEQLEDKDGILSWLIERWNLEELRSLTWFAWTLRNRQKKDIGVKLIPLWVELSQHADPSSETGKRTLSMLGRWSVFIDELNEQTMDLLLKAAPYANLEHDAYILIEELQRLVEQYPDQVADIFILMLDSFAPTFQQEDIERIISKLYKNEGENRLKANTICDKYIKHGIEFPVEIRARYSHS